MFLHDFCMIVCSYKVGPPREQSWCITSFKYGLKLWNLLITIVIVKVCFMILATSYITIVIYSQIVKGLYKPAYYNVVGSTRRQDDDFASGASQASRRRRRSTSHGCDEAPLEVTPWGFLKNWLVLWSMNWFFPYIYIYNVNPGSINPWGV